MKKLLFQTLTLLSFLIGVQTLQAQHEIGNLENMCFSMTIKELPPANDREQCFEITVKPKNLSPGQKLVIVDVENDKKYECVSNTGCTFEWCYDFKPDLQYPFIECFIEGKSGESYCRDGCTIIIEPR